MTDDIIEGVAVVQFLSDTFIDPRINIKCPNCDFPHYTHIHSVGTLVSRSTIADPMEIYEGTFPTGTTLARRSALEIVFECENCIKLFSLIIQQDKGVNHLKINKNAGDKIPCDS